MAGGERLIGGRAGRALARAPLRRDSLGITTTAVGVLVSRSRVHAMFAVVTVALLCCTSWGRPFGTSRLAPGSAPERLRLSLTGGRRVEMVRPRVRGDTLFGDTLGIAAGIPFRDIDSVSQREINAPMTALAVAVAAGGVIYLVIKGAQALQQSIDESSKQSCHIGKIDG